ncbi:GNAT family N-acetyltransferase [Planctomonas deserti]|uniref:GNAT family N-acetyltransferase n=1 Tax=Planctomonas deserti TaxID=2144185 RepID=UPI000D36FFDE|nr:GNAT family N-acetyltransferase [Planctomonas deserti]
MTDVTVRPVSDDDVEEWSALFRAYRDFYRLPPDPHVVDRVWGWLVDQDHEVNAFVAEVEGRVVGFAHYRPFSRPSTGTVGLYLDDLFASPDVRGTGVGRALVDEVTAVARRDGRSVVRWITAEDNVQARRLYDGLAHATHWVTYDRIPNPA